MLSLSRPSKWYGWKSIYTALNFGIFAKISKASVFIQYCIVMILLLLALSSQPWWGSLSSSHVVSILYLHQSCTNKNFSGRRTSQISPMVGFGLFCCTNKPLKAKKYKTNIHRVANNIPKKRLYIQHFGSKINLNNT